MPARKTDFGDLRQFFEKYGFFWGDQGGGWGGKLTLTCPHDPSGRIKICGQVIFVKPFGNFEFGEDPSRPKIDKNGV